MASGCDNVSWGGIDVHLKPPEDPSATVEAPVEEVAEEVEDTLPARPEPPILFTAVRSGRAAVLIPVGELQGATLTALPTADELPGFRARLIGEIMAPGSRFTLFGEGVRVGTLIVGDDLPTQSPYCLNRPQVEGAVELIPDIPGPERFLALPEEVGRSFAYGSYRSLTHAYDHRVASLNMGSSLISQVGAAWPATLLEIRRDLQVFTLNGEEPPAVAVTFVYGDELSQQPAPDNAYSLFILGQDRGEGYRPVFFRYRPVGEQGKGAPRYLSRLDWDRDGQEQLLLEVFGQDARWFAVVGRQGNRWQTVFEDPCASSSF